jgi:uncharacterized protein (TIGR00162 family)
MSWILKQVADEKITTPILIEGMPGIGNVGKIAVDFLIEELKTKKIYEMHSYSLPHSVFVNENNLVEMPKIEMYHLKFKKKDFLFLSGDVQPADESCYEFTEAVVELCRKYKCKDIITIGGIGLMDIPKKPKVYCTGNSKKAVEKYKDKSINTSLYGVVGPIIGVSGLLLGMADKDMDAVAFLAETYGHPMYLGVKGAKEVLRILDKEFGFGIKLAKLDKEITDIEQDMLKRTEELAKIQQGTQLPLKTGQEVNYIG